ncbi:MAG TPA: sugar-binding protein, partial [Chloroflexia bacterium]|nr:sugar-binding protein [Chloroflexia bacterium]
APPLRTLSPGLPGALQPILDRALTKNPALRYPTATQMLQALAAVAVQAPPDTGRAEPQGAAAFASRPAPIAAPPAGAPVALAPTLAPAVGPAVARGGWTPAPAILPTARPRLAARPLLLIGAAVLIVLGIGALALAALHGGAGAPPILGGAAFGPPSGVAYTGPRRAGNGDDLRANRALQAPTIDGALDDWSGAAHWPAPYVVADPKLTPPQGAADLSAAFLIGYDDTNFYLGATITDDVHVQNGLTRGLELWKGDDVELWFDTNLAGDFTLDPGNDDDFQLGFSPGDFAQFGPEAALFRPVPQPGPPPGVRVAARPRAGGHGYTLEAAVPWAVLRMHPAPGGAIGFCASAGDNDVPGTAQQQHMVSTCQRMQWNVPTTFGNLFW